ncbi:hypothetical protein [Nocardioides plantarum]|uniref:Uncharacterized protein n=1 Tax=Nocardioides plantarum TaxID=29299 RepID=A0ABV5KA35_9ACTN|nr:hypothetical protein [Nocardioides plantarum]
MDTPTTLRPRPGLPVVLVVMLVAGLVLAPLMFALQVGSEGPQPDAVEMGVVGPVVVSQSVVERAAALPGAPRRVVVLPEDDDPADAVRRGLLDATVDIDLGKPYDVLRVSSTADPDLVAAVRAQVASVSLGYGRVVRVVEVRPVRNPDAWRGTPYAVVVAWIVLGVALAIGLLLVAGSRVTSTRQALTRVLVLAVLSVVAAFAIALVVSTVTASTDLGLLRTTAVGATTIAATAWLIRGAEAVFGLAGLAVAGSFSLAALAPLLALTDPAGLPSPWPDIVPWTVPGAALSLTRADVFFGTSVGVRPVAVLLSWLVLALLTLGAAVVDRPADEPADESAEDPAVPAA